MKNFKITQKQAHIIQNLKPGALLSNDKSDKFATIILCDGGENIYMSGKKSTNVFDYAVIDDGVGERDLRPITENDVKNLVEKYYEQK